MRSRIYEITFAGQAGPVLTAAFGDCQVATRASTTTVRIQLPDPQALKRLMDRIADLGLEVTGMHLLAPSPPLSP